LEKQILLEQERREKEHKEKKGNLLL